MAIESDTRPDGDDVEALKELIRAGIASGSSPQDVATGLLLGGREAGLSHNDVAEVVDELTRGIDEDQSAS